MRRSKQRSTIPDFFLKNERKLLKCVHSNSSKGSVNAPPNYAMQREGGRFRVGNEQFDWMLFICAM